MRRRLLVALLALSGCAKSSQMVVGLLTDIPTPNKLQSVQLVATRDEVDVVDETFSPISSAPNEPYTLPGSFDFTSAKGGTPVLSLTVSAYGADPLTPIVTRTATVQYESEKVLFLRMAVVTACMNVVCPNNATCIEGTCQPETRAASTLPEYDKALASTVECNSGTTFIDTSTCGDGTACVALPIGAGCAAGETCVEGTCYASQ